jgi:hypothetical protein
LEIAISREYLKTCKLFIATPCYGGICGGIYAKCMADLSAVCTQLQIQLQIYMLFNESLITRARNYSCDEFMRSDATHFLFIDSDIGFDPSYIIQLMALQTVDSPYDVIGAPYPKKCISWEKIKAAVDKGLADDEHGGPGQLEKFVGDYVFNPKGGTQSIQIGEPCEVLEIGTGFMMIKRKTMEIFRDAHPELLYRPDHVRTEHFDGSRQITQFFQAEIDQIDHRLFYEAKLNEVLSSVSNSGMVPQEAVRAILDEAKEFNSRKSNRYLSEDYWFCQKIQDLQLKTWLCPWMALNHTGSMVYGGSLADIARLGASPTADVNILNKYKNKQVTGNAPA